MKSPQNVSRETSQETSAQNVSRETQILAVINQKGGVGKTTTAVSLATALAIRGYRTLLIDLDPQGNAATSLGIDRYEDKTPLSYDLLFGDGTAPLPLGPNLSVFAGNSSLISADLELLQRGESRERALERAIAPLKSDFDFILIDSPPSLGLLTLNILVASRWVVIPIQCEYLALEGLTMLLETLEQITADRNPSLEVLGCLITMTDLRTNLSQQVVADVREHLNERVFETMIPRSVRLSECPSHGKSIFDYERWGAGARSYDSLTREILRRIRLPERAQEARS